MPSMGDVDMKHIKNKILEKIRLGVGVKSSNNIESGSENTLMQGKVGTLDRRSIESQIETKLKLVIRGLTLIFPLLPRSCKANLSYVGIVNGTCDSRSVLPRGCILNQVKVRGFKRRRGRHIPERQRLNPA